MKWTRDDLVDQLIANNAARPRPGMDKPDVAMMTLTGKVQKTAATAKGQTADSAPPSALVPSAPSKPNMPTD